MRHGHWLQGRVGEKGAVAFVALEEELEPGQGHPSNGSLRVLRGALLRRIALL